MDNSIDCIDYSNERLDMTLFLCEAFATNEKTYKYIDNIYNKDKITYITKAKTSKWYNCIMATEGSIQQEYYFKKTLGVLLVAYTNTELLAQIVNIMDKCWRYASTYIKQNNVIKIKEFATKFIKKYKGLENIGLDEMNANFVILLFLANAHQKEIDEDEFYVDFLGSLCLRIIHMRNGNRISLKGFDKDILKQVKKIELKLKGLLLFDTKPCSYHVHDKISELRFNNDILTETDKIFFPFDYLFDFEQISLIEIVGKNYLKSKDIQEIILAYLQFYKSENDFNFDDFLRYLYPAIQIRYLCKEYKKAKKFFFDNFDEKLYNEIDNLTQENTNLQTNNKVLEDENIKLKQQIELLKSQNNKLQDENDKLNTSNSELFALRNFIFSQATQNSSSIQSDTNNIDIDKLNSLKGIVIGGRTSLQQKLKEKLSNWTFISVDTINFDVDILKNANHIFLNVNVLSHAMYYKVTEVTNKLNKNIHFLNNNNVDICLNSIYNTIYTE